VDTTKLLEENKKYFGGVERANLDEIKRVEEEVIEELFNDLIKTVKTSLESAKEKFRFHFKRKHEEILKGLINLKELEFKSSQNNLKEKLRRINLKDEKSIVNFVDSTIILNEWNESAGALSISDKIKSLPRIDKRVFSKHKEDILRTTDDTLKKLLEAHVS
jgi:hypothetical protein